jgi:hypothetical protein
MSVIHSAVWSSQPIGWQYWLCLGLSFVSAAVSLGFSLAALFGADGKNVYVRYAAARSVAVLAAVVLAAFVALPVVAFIVAVTMTLVQALDAVIGATQKNAMKTWGPAFLAVLTAVAAILLVTA